MLGNLWKEALEYEGVSSRRGDIVAQPAFEELALLMLTGIIVTTANENYMDYSYQ
jgi:hypothetical protein